MRYNLLVHRTTHKELCHQLLQQAQGFPNPGRESLLEAAILKEVQSEAIEQLLVLAPHAGGDRCRNVLEQCDFDVSAAACELLSDGNHG